MARGRVWEARLGAADDSELSTAAVVVDQVPEEGGGSRVRILCAEAPHPAAVTIDPTLEDGYFQLVGARIQ